MSDATPTPMAAEPLATAEEVASHLRISQSMVYKLAREGSLPVVRIGSLLRFNWEHVRAFARGELVTRSNPVVSLKGRKRNVEK
jgi:excisionase family DNA binding protein